MLVVTTLTIDASSTWIPPDSPAEKQSSLLDLVFRRYRTAQDYPRGGGAIEQIG